MYSGLDAETDDVIDGDPDVSEPEEEDYPADHVEFDDDVKVVWKKARRDPPTTYGEVKVVDRPAVTEEKKNFGLVLGPTAQDPTADPSRPRVYATALAPPSQPATAAAAIAWFTQLAHAVAAYPGTPYAKDQGFLGITGQLEMATHYHAQVAILMDRKLVYLTFAKYLVNLGLVTNVYWPPSQPVTDPDVMAKEWAYCAKSKTAVPGDNTRFDAGETPANYHPLELNMA